MVKINLALRTLSDLIHGGHGHVQPQFSITLAIPDISTAMENISTVELRTPAKFEQGQADQYLV